MAKLETLVNDLKNKLQASESERSKLKGKLESLQEDYNFSVSQNKSLSNELETLGKEKERWITKHDNLTKSMSNSDENLKEIEIKINKCSIETREPILEEYLIQS